jgi:TonB family protein
MADILLQMLLDTTIGLALVLLLRRPARRLVGPGPAFTLWLLPVVLPWGSWLPQRIAPAGMVVLPGLTVTPYSGAGLASGGAAFDWPLLLTVVWLAGTALWIARLAWHYLRLRVDARRASPEWLEEIRASMPTLDIRRVRVHAHGPAVLWSLPRSLVLLPPDFRTRFVGATTRELVLRHELTHARRGDGWWMLAMEMTCALLWFHPLAWLARPRFRLDQELACDATALRGMPNRAGHYARTLVDSVAARPGRALIPWLTEPQLKERIAMIIRNPASTLRRRAGYSTVALILGSGLWLAGGHVPAQAVTPASTSAATPPSVDVGYKNSHPPHYPDEALGKGEQGTVLLEVSVDASGNVKNVEVDADGTTAAPDLQEAAVQAAHGWKYRPGMRDGQPVGGVVAIPVKFSLTPLTPVEEPASTDSPPSVDTESKRRNVPPYPAAALKKGEHGVVMLHITVDDAGHVENVAVDKTATTAPESLQTAAVAAVREWTFNPGRKNGQPVGGTLQVPITFSLRSAPAATNASVMMRLHLDENGKVDQATVDHSYPTSASPEMQAKMVSQVIGVPFSKGKDGGKLPSGWYMFPIPVPPETASSAHDAVGVTATPIH